MSVPPAFGIRLKQRRQALDLTQEALAERVGCAPQTIRKIESGERRPSRDMAERLAQVLDVSPADRDVFLKEARTALVPDSPLPPSAPVERPAPRMVLPKYTRPFVGRSAELAQLSRLLETPGCDLITVVGPGGIGKTRLAVEAASRQSHFVDGVVFVSLAAVTSASLLASAIGDALSFAFNGSDEPAVQLSNYLREKELLLVLDNMEQLLEGSELLVTLLADAPQVRCLVTSRERLNVQDEWVVELMGLSVLAAGPADGAADAVTLFVERARRVQQAFTLNDTTMRSIVRICELVDGMPLGIELAASWVRLLSVSEIEDEISRSFDILSTSARDLPGRHQSLRAVFEHSWHLLTDVERQVLRRLTVFHGGFDRAAAATIAGASLPVLAALVDKSLLRRTTDGRYDLHGLVRQYAAAHLVDDTSEQADVQDRHCTYYIGWLESRTDAIQGRNQATAIREVSDEIDNVRAAWAWATSRQMLSEHRRGLGVLQWFYEYRTWFQEGETTFRETAAAVKAPLNLPAVAEQATEEQTERALLLGHLLAAQGYLAVRCGQLARACDVLRSSLQLLRTYGDGGCTARPLVYLGIASYQMGNYDEAQDALQQSLEIDRAGGGGWIAALSLCFLGLVAHSTGDYNRARELFSEDLAIWRSINNVRGLALCLNFFSTTLFKLSEYTEVQALLHESLALCAATGDRWGLGTALNHLGLVAQAQGEHEQAHYLFSESLALFREMGDRWAIARAQNHLGAAAWAIGDHVDAKRSYFMALRTAQELKATPDALNALAGLAQVLASEGNHERALEVVLQVMGDAASGKEAYERASLLYAELTELLPPQRVESIAQRLSGRTFDAVVEELSLFVRERAISETVLS